MSLKTSLGSFKPFKALVRGATRLLPDKAYIKLKYYWMFGKMPDLKHPTTYNEKLNWLKLYDRKPIYNTLVDKYEVKQYVANLIGKEHLIPTYGVWDSVEEIDFDSLPQSFVIKGTHDGGSVILCRNKNTFDLELAKKKLRKSLKTNFYWHGREWPYKAVKHRIIAEAFMEDKETAELRDYKFFCFDGIVRALFIATDRQKKDTDTKFDFFDAEGNHLPIKQGHPNAEIPPVLPQNFEKMKEFAALLSNGIPQVRVDFYEVNGNIYFGELTFSHFDGLVPFVPDKWDRVFGDWIKLPNVIDSQ